MSKFGGGGTKCKICDKTAYPAETISFEKEAYHVDCFKCTTCSKKMEGAAKAQKFEDAIYCSQCFQKNGFANKQKNVKWTKKEGTTGSAAASKFGGGGNPCLACSKTVYPAEALSFEKKIFHQDCFTCSECNKKMTPSGAAKFEDPETGFKIFCTKCFSAGGYNRKQANQKGTGTTSSSNAMASKFGGGGTKCVKCDKTVYAAETISFEKNAYHQECFTCINCDVKLNPSAAEGKKNAEDGSVAVYCKKCWGELGLNRAKVEKAAC